MKKLIFLLVLFMPSICFAEDYVCPDASYHRSLGSQPNGCTAIPASEVAAQRDIERSVPQKYRKVVNDLLLEMSASEKSDVDSEEAATLAALLLSTSRSTAKNSVDELSPDGVRLRASLLVVLDRTNAIAAKVDAIDACNTDNTTAAAIRSCIIALDPLGSPTASQMKTAIKNEIDAGNAD